MRIEDERLSAKVRMKTIDRTSILRLVMALLLGALCSSQSAEPTKSKMVKVITKKDGDLTHFFVENLEAGEVTATFTVATDNHKSTVAFPYTSTYPAHQITEAFALTPVDSKNGWGYSYTNHFTMGNHRAVHDDSCVYLLPYVAGSGFRVTQGYN